MIIAAVVEDDATSISQLGALSVTPLLTSSDCELDGSSTRMHTLVVGLTALAVADTFSVWLTSRSKVVLTAVVAETVTCNRDWNRR